MKGLETLEINFLHSRAIFRIKLANHDDVFMSVSKKDAFNDERCILIVDGKKLLNLWKEEPYNFNPELSHGNATSWPKDRKYPLAEKGFSQGFNNPVPVVKVVCDTFTKKRTYYKRKYLVFREFDYVDEYTFNYVDFIDGITRTIWLLAHGAKYLPVECHVRDGIKLLAESAAYDECEYKTVEQLIS